MTDNVRNALERAKRFIDACATEGELTPNDKAENPCDLVNAIDQALAAQPSAGAQGEAVAKIAAALVSIDRIFPVHVTETPDYAELAFNECGAKAMTVEPDTWTALNTLGDDLRSLLALYATPDQPDTGDVAALRDDYRSAFKIASDLHAAYEQLIYGLPKYLEAENLTDEQNMIREAFITLDVTAHRLAALSKPNAQGREG